MQIFAVICCVMIAFAGFIKSQKATSDAPSQVDDSQTLSEALQEAFRNRNYWLIHAGFFVCGFQVMFIATHLPSYLGDKGL